MEPDKAYGIVSILRDFRSNKFSILLFPFSFMSFLLLSGFWLLFSVLSICLTNLWKIGKSNGYDCCNYMLIGVNRLLKYFFTRNPDAYILQTWKPYFAVW